jgi:two-component system alkaline phosphatase synthesis response regulator PhoP
MKKIFIVEDDPHIASLIQEKLKTEPFEITLESDGIKAYEKALVNNYEIILLDIMLPGMAGTEICKQLRLNRVKSIIIMLTSKAEEIDKVLGLEIGADDYITKPFSPRELLSRINARIRRLDETTVNEISGQRASEDKILDFNDIKIDIGKRRVTKKNKEIELTPKEFELLILLSAKPGKTYTRLQLLNLVWGTNFEGYEHTVNTHINRLRIKIESDSANPQYILTTWGVGYKFKDLTND